MIMEIIAPAHANRVRVHACNAETYLKQKFGKELDTSELRTSLAYTVETAAEYYRAATAYACKNKE